MASFYALNLRKKIQKRTAVACLVKLAGNNNSLGPICA